MLFRQQTDTGKRATTRSAAGNEAQLRELRGKARRRLIGALALVLAAFIIVPWLFDEPVPDDTHAPIVVPATPAGLPPPISPAPLHNAGTLAASEAPQPATPAGTPPEGSASGAATPPSSAPVTSVPPASSPPPAPAEAKPQPDKVAAEPAKPVAEPAKPSKPSPKPVERTDDGSVALALLAGKSSTPVRSQAPASSQGRYYLQVAAYTTEQDAQVRRDSLRQSGVTDAYVERGQSSGRTVYRLRVGPFSSHEAAQAAQARLRALGYQNGLISDK